MVEKDDDVTAGFDADGGGLGLAWLGGAGKRLLVWLLVLVLVLVT